MKRPTLLALSMCLVLFLFMVATDVFSRGGGGRGGFGGGSARGGGGAAYSSGAASRSPSMSFFQSRPSPIEAFAVAIETETNESG